MIGRVKSIIGRKIVNILGWKTDRKIIVIESDDWGGISMPSKEAYETLLKNDIKVNTNPYSRYDSLASEQDLEALFEVLLKYKDSNGNPPVITANTNVANPDFKKIKESGFKEYHYEPFTETLKRYPKHTNSFNLWKEGINQKIFIPQFHGREHLNAQLWLNELKEGKNKKLQLAFDLECFNLSKDAFLDNSKIYNTAFYPSNEHERKSMFSAIPSGLKLFEDIIGYKATSFIGTGYFWNREIEKILQENGVMSLQGLPIQKEPRLNGEKHTKRYNYTGKINQHKQVFLVRNTFFEPTLKQNIDTVNDCIERIEVAFANKTPAIISSHRLNFIGYIDEQNRTDNLIMLNALLKKIVQLWPDVEFMSSDQLAKIINTKKDG
ncbi:hypothetical protein DVK85_02490 [Flavobacterium arcticum]|uniref:Polysaccharide (De)acetylase n=1 Tax=Flavobacterium arcticum TaxID=1784713 RepID=A0A345H992_9FLAO|nr:hypothetical protein [Flavobacterium arcticum]AXG73152.1 hypothetical protein DVK85_02490 [Flavobacterium arcticum]KAF2512944.1 hypothetical protein E0W72_00555 [Flavobacterium arcticum]